MQTQSELHAAAFSCGSSVSGQTSKVQDGLNLRWVDALRGLAILMVIMVHAEGTVGIYMPAGTAGPAWTLFGRRGVQLFYMLSAFTLLLSMDHARPQRNPLRNFYLRRFFQIAPLFYVAVVLNQVQIHFYRKAPLPLLNLVLGVFFLNGIRPDAMNAATLGGWSISVEMTFYLLLPFLYKYLNTIGRCLLASAVAAVLFWNLSTYLNRSRPGPVWTDYLTTFWFPVEFPIFLFGMFTYLLWRQTVNTWKLRPRRSSVIAFLRSCCWSVRCLFLCPRFPRSTRWLWLRFRLSWPLPCGRGRCSKTV